jgi:hypothetical protein
VAEVAVPAPPENPALRMEYVGPDETAAAAGPAHRRARHEIKNVSREALVMRVRVATIREGGRRRFKKSLMVD